ncbi:MULTISPECIES: hypothetical protein [unclassified Halomonas]|uniref:hypothetical protein n=1 Tax=unclassified Halomonas TaxID=2609666 RepID=UPI0020A1FCD5|nr:MULTISPECIES: hypothetical protein [unclassified Halomonas]MCP1316022.1 hypothetical protein [Halomonas sp. 707D7]MCP1327795.1 hypothetical protein [Halomonas sp. 707D4]
MAQEVESQQYHFGVRWSVDGVPSSMRIQDILLNFTGTPSDLDTRLPVSQYIKNGRNKVNLNSWPMQYEPDSELKISLLYWEPGQNPNTEASSAFDVVMKPGQNDADPEVVFLDPGAPLQPLQSDIEFKRFEDYDTLEVVFNNHQQMPIWCWEKGDILSNTDAVRDSLAREYRRLHALFEARNNDALMNASSTMIEELALASGESEAYVRQRASYDMFFDNPNLFELDPFPEEPMKLNLAADNRVAWLTTEGVNVPIAFGHAGQEHQASFVRLYFIQRDGQWEICR